jgi:hypothetical protein
MSQVKDVAKEQDEEEKDRKMMSDSASITDANYKDLMSTKAAWLVLFYSDESDESWELHPSWERVVEDLRDLQVPAYCLISSKIFELFHFILRLWVSAASILTWTRPRAASSFLSLTCSLLPSCTEALTARRSGACLHLP